MLKVLKDTKYILTKNIMYTSNFLTFSRSDYVYDLFAHMTLDEEGGASGGRAFKMDRRAGAKKKATVSSQFKVWMTEQTQ